MGHFNASLPPNEHGHPPFYYTLGRWWFWHSNAMGNENEQNKPPKLNYPSLTRGSLAWGVYFVRSRFPWHCCETRTTIFLVCARIQRKQRNAWHRSQAKLKTKCVTIGTDYKQRCARQRCAKKFPIEQICNNIIRDGSIKLFVGCSAEVLRTNR